MGKILETNNEVTGTMTHNILLTRNYKGIMPTYRDGVPKDPYRRRHGHEEEGRKDDSNIVPFCMTRLAAFTYLLSNVMRFKRFLSHQILTISWCLKYKTRSRWEKFSSSYDPFFHVVQITILATARISINTTAYSPWNGGKTLSLT